MLQCRTKYLEHDIFMPLKMEIGFCVPHVLRYMDQTFWVHIHFALPVVSWIFLTTNIWVVVRTCTTKRNTDKFPSTTCVRSPSSPLLPEWGEYLSLTRDKTIFIYSAAYKIPFECNSCEKNAVSMGVCARTCHTECSQVSEQRLVYNFFLFCSQCNLSHRNFLNNFCSPCALYCDCFGSSMEFVCIDACRSSWCGDSLLSLWSVPFEAIFGSLHVSDFEWNAAWLEHKLFANTSMLLFFSVVWDRVEKPRLLWIGPLEAGKRRMGEL